MQVDAPAGDAVPAPHDEQTGEPPAAKVPAAQLVHSELPPSDALPAAHGEQLVAPSAEKLPGSHGVQLAAPGLIEKLPAAQGAQLLASSLEEKVPGEQLAQLVSALAVQAWTRDWPGWQTVHEAQALALVNHAPPGQLVQAVALPLQVAQLASQLTQVQSASAWQLALWYSPAGQPLEQATQVPLLE